MKPPVVLLLVHAAFLLGGCATRRSQDDPVGSAVGRLAAIDVDPSHYATDAEYETSVCGQIRDVVVRVPSASQLKEFYYECSSISKEMPHAPLSVRKQFHHEGRSTPTETPTEPGDPRFRIDVGEAAALHIYYRLAALGSDDGARALVDLFADENLKFGCDHGISLCSAITRCGKRALPYLAKLAASGRASRLPEDRGNMIAGLITRIEKGEFYNPDMDAANVEQYGVPVSPSGVQRPTGAARACNGQQ